MKLFDSHCHLNDERFNEDRESLIIALKNEGVEKLVTAGYSLESSKEAIKLANKYDFIYATIGISPNDVPDNNEKLGQEIEQLKEVYKMSKKHRCRRRDWIRLSLEYRE